MSGRPINYTAIYRRSRERYDPAHGRAHPSTTLELDADLDPWVAKAEGRIAGALMGAVEGAGDLVKDYYRDETRRAFAGSPSLPTTWRGKLYPPPGTTSVEPAYFLWSNAPDIIAAHAAETTILPNGARMLAVPIPGSPAATMRRTAFRSSFGKSLVSFVRQAFGPMFVIPARAGRPAMLALQEVGFTPKGRLTRKKRLKSGALRTGSAVVPMFFLLPSVRVRRRLDLDRMAERARDIFVADLRNTLNAGVDLAA